MAGALLRTGSLKEFRALGALGNPVYSAAGQLRAAIQRHLGAPIADLFAIPRQNERGDAIDWYAPEPGDVVPWSAATPEQRAAAKEVLLAARAQLAAHSQALQSEDRSERQVFGQLLTQVTQIPSDDHIYLVKNSPVMTFWGFHPLDAPPGLDVLADLHTGPATPPAPPPVGPAAVPPTPLPVEPPRRRWWWWLLLLLLLALLLALLLLRSCGRVVVPVLPEAPLAVVPGATPTALAAGQREVLENGRRYIADTNRGMLVDPETGRDVRPLRPDELADKPSPAVPVDAAPSPPLDQAQPTSPPAPPQQQPNAPTPPAPPEQQPNAPTPPAPVAAQTAAAEKPPEEQPNAATPPAQPAPQTPGAEEPRQPPGEPPAAPAGTPLTIPQNAVQEGSTDFLNGRYRSITGVTDDKGNPVELDYEFKSGQGTVSLRRSVGNTQHVCSGKVGSNLRDGKLRIDQKDVRCPDGVTFQDSSVECSVGAGGKAVCQGSNADGTKYDVSIVK